MMGGARSDLAMPAIGFGCSPYRGGRVVDMGAAVELALEAGYRLLDTAELYGNERQIGEILRRSSAVARREIFLVSKLWRTNHGYDQVLAACAESLERLGVERLDLYLIHAPQAWRHMRMLGDLSRVPLEEARARAFPVDGDGAAALSDVPLSETWQAMEELRRRGWVDTIGVSNFEQPELERLLRGAQSPPTVVQIERTPYHPRNGLIEECRRRGIRVMAHSPLSTPGLLAETVLEEIARICGKSVAQVVLRWHLDEGVVPLPSSLDRAHIRDNIDILDFRLGATHHEAIAGLARKSDDPATVDSARPHP